MKIDEKVRKTLAELAAGEPSTIHALFEEARRASASERQEAIGRGACGEAERQHIAQQLRDRWLARKNGLLAHIDANWLKTASLALKPAVGREFNQLREAVAGFDLAELLQAIPLRAESQVQTLPAPHEAAHAPTTRTPDDLTLPGARSPLGSLHPVTQVQREIEDIFVSLGFAIETGPEIESVYYNFDALNIPESHPSRDDWDTFYIDAQTVLRTHTSPVQVRAMEKYGAPLYIIIPGRCYRHDNPDSTHSPVFYQIEGLVVDTHITFADLKGTLDFFARRFFGAKTRTSFHPSFFPFTEPSGEVSIACPFCDSQGCRVCKQSGWIEVMGCGMVHPEVLRFGGLDPSRYTGWAFGLGVERYAMMKYDIDDIQLFYQSDVRFLEQF
jgi:phenylalanyl-tRNA synthetase alpha chain